MAHVLKLHTFSKFIFPRRQIWNRDIDKSADSEHIRLISERTGIAPQRIFASTLNSFAGSLYETHNPNGNLSWILPVGVHRLTRKRFGLQICPLCLSEDEEPYFRRTWRVSWTTVCLKHEVILLDKCPDCRNPIIFHRGDMGWRNQHVSLSMVQCSICSLYWISQKVIKSLIIADSDIIAFQSKLENALTDGWSLVPGGFGMVHSISFFNGLKHIMRVLSVSPRTESFKRAVSQQSEIQLGTVEFSGERTRSFDYLPIESRYPTLRLAAWLLAEWSGRFVETAVATETFSSAFLSYSEVETPLWYWLPIYENLIRKTHPVSEEEIKSALNFLEKRKSFILPMDLERLVGRNFFEYKSDKFVISIYERMKKFNESKEIERLRNIRLQAKEVIANHGNSPSKTKARSLSRKYRRKHSKPDKHFKKTQRMFARLITRYKRRERLKMVKRMEKEQSATVVAKEFGVSPGIVTKWYRRYKEGGVANLDDRSRAPYVFRHQIIFEEQEKWIRALHAERLELTEIQNELKNRYGFHISQGGLFRALNRLELILPCSKKNRFVKNNRKRSRSKRHLH